MGVHHTLMVQIPKNQNQKGMVGVEERERDRYNPQPTQGTSSLQTQHVWTQEITSQYLPGSH